MENRAPFFPDRKKTWRDRILETASRQLTHKRLALHLSIVAILFTLPALWVGLQLDDFGQRFTMLGLNKSLYPGSWHFLDVYSFLKDDPFITELIRNMGGLPWWTPSDLRVSFMRYISALFLWLDYKLWPNWPSLMHLHSLLWYAALTAAVTALYRRFMGLSVAAGLAALFFTLDYSHGLPAGWLANRYALLCAFFGVLCLLSYDRWRRHEGKWHGALCPLYLALALMSGEMAVAVGAYLFAYALFLDDHRKTNTEGPPPLSGRLLALWPCAIVFISWLLLYKMLGYGTHGSGIYIDPASAPLEYVRALVTRAPLLLMGQWSHLSADFVGRVISEQKALIRALIFLALMAFILVPLIRHSRIARFWLAGTILSILPVAAAGPSNRSLLFIGIGAMALTAQCVIHIRRQDGIFPRSRIWRIPAMVIVAYLVLVRLVISPLLLPVVSYYMKPYGEHFVSAAQSITADPHIAQQEIILVNPPDHLSPQLIWFVGSSEKERPARMRVLSGGPFPVEVYRLDDHVLRVKISGGLFDGPLGTLFRSPVHEPISVNQEFSVDGMTARVTAIDEKNGPTEIIYRFSKPLDDPSLKWFAWRDCGYQSFVLPPVGTSVILPGFDANDIFRNKCDKFLPRDAFSK